MSGINWSSKFSKYLFIAGILIGVIGLSPFNRRTGNELWLTSLVQTGPELLGFHLVQWIMMFAGLAAVGTGLYIERYS